MRNEVKGCSVAVGAKRLTANYSRQYSAEAELPDYKECGKPLPRGNSLISQTARELGYCLPVRPRTQTGRYCYQMNVSDAPEVDEVRGAEVFDPEEPWNWYEYFFPENER